MSRRLDARCLAAAMTCAVLAAACGGGQQNSEAPATTAAPAAPARTIDPATTGTVTGKITFAGTAPAPEPIKMTSDPSCAQQGGPATTETLLVGNGGGLQNVFVYVKDGLGNQTFPAPATAVTLDQRGCHYVPHVLGIQVGQPLEIVNDDPTLHNVHAVPKANGEFNTGQPLKGMKHVHTFSTKEVMVPFKCDVHGWMNAYVGVLDHPFYAVTTPDGSFSLQGLPPGTYTIEAWHEKLGTQTQTVTVAATETKDVAMTFKL
jgi:plastocyanin